MPALEHKKEKVMPSVLIEVRRQYTAEQEVALIEAVHAALREAFKILPGDKKVRFIVHEPHRFACPPAREKSGFIHVLISKKAPGQIGRHKLPWPVKCDNACKLLVIRRTKNYD
jgi:hypothetical protein